MFDIRQILPDFILPVGLTLIMLLGGLISGRRWLAWTAFAFLWFGSTRAGGSLAMRAAERWAERVPAAQAPHSDAIVVLSAGRLVAPGSAAINEWGDPDRFFGGLELFQAGKAPVLVFCGGSAPWEPQIPPEGQILAGYAKALGVPPDRILVTGPVATTAEEARAVADLLRRRQTTTPRILLVTSAFHMPRARQLFQGQGLTVMSFPVDFQVPATRGFGVVDLIPDAAALWQTHVAMRETYGSLFYRAASLFGGAISKSSAAVRSVAP